MDELEIDDIIFPDEESNDGYNDQEIFFPDEETEIDNAIISLTDQPPNDTTYDDYNCCSDLCFSQLSRQDIRTAKEGYPKDTISQANWILNYIQMFSIVSNYVSNGKLLTNIKTNFCICGKVMCENSWRKIYGISEYKFRKYSKMFLSGKTIVMHGNTDTLKMQHNSTECLGWLLNYVSSIGEHLPNENKIELPAGMTKKDVFQKMDEELGITAIPDKSKYRLWQKFCSNVKTTKGSTFSKCHLCISVNDCLLTSIIAKDQSKAELLRTQRQEHWNDIREERLEYYKRRDMSRQNPTQMLCIIIDAMDQCKTALPILKRRVSKEINSRVVPPIKTYLTGALIHRQGHSHNKVGHCYFDFTQYCHDTNLNISVLMEILKDYKNELGNQLHLQMDSASNNKNSLMIAFGGMLVHLKIFKEVYFHMLPVGHTHEDVDAMFHNIADVLKVDVFTFPDLISQIKKIAFIQKVNQIQTVWDIKSWLESNMMGCHGFNDCFHIHIHYNKGILVWHYKKWSKNKWLPDATDPLTYLDERDKDGIVIFKTLPTGMPNVVPPLWNADIVKQLDFVSKKLIKSGLLTPSEKEWWQGLTVNRLQDEVHETEHTCPLEELIEATCNTQEETPVLPEELINLQRQQKRVNVAYSGKYINPSKRSKTVVNNDSIDTYITDDTEMAYQFPVTTKSGRVLLKEFEKDVKDDIERKNIGELMNHQIKTLSQQFANNIGIFKERFDSYIKFMGQKFSSELQQTYNSIEQNKWLAVAQFLRRSVKNVRDLENLPTRPFIEWMGIPQELTLLSLDKPIPIPELPKFDEVFQPSVKIPNSDKESKQRGNQGYERANQYHNFWFHPNMYPSNQTESSQNFQKEEEKSSYDGYMIFFALMVVIDFVWFVHRMLKAVGVCSLLLYGYPIYVDIRDKTEHTQENEDETIRRQKKWFKSGFCKSLRDFVLKTLVSMFVPKVIATVVVCLFVYMLSMATFHFVNRETFSYLGYYNNMDDLLKLNEKFINRRLETHASRINLMQYPAYQELTNMFVQRHLFLYKSTENRLETMHDGHTSFYCDYLRSLNVSAVCDVSVPTKVPDVVVTACQFEKISPRHYLRHTMSSNISDLQMDEFLFSIRKLIEDTCYIVLIFMSITIVKELLGTVIWLYMKRSGFINLRIIFEADEPPNAPHK